MRRHAFPGPAAHLKRHYAFFESLDQLTYNLEICGPSQQRADRDLEVAQDCFIDHIVDEHQKYATMRRGAPRRPHLG